MNFAVMTVKPFVTSKKLDTTLHLSEETKSRRKFMRENSLSIEVDPSTGEVTTNIEEKQ